MKYLLLFLVLLGGMFSSSTLRAQPNVKMEFSYVPNESIAASPCKFTQIQDLPDWRVRCDTLWGQKEFVAHVIVREYPREGQNLLEIMYWITDRSGEGKENPRFHSSSVFLKLSGKSSLAEASLSQAVENDFASLTLNWRRE